MILNGAFQSTVWPGLLKVMGNWFKDDKNALLMGLWASNSKIGNIIGY